MSTLRQQIKQLFEGVNPYVQELVYDVLEIETDYIHMQRPRGVMDELYSAIEKVAKNSLKDERES